MSSTFAGFCSCLLILGGVAHAQSANSAANSVIRRVELVPEDSRTAVEVEVSPGLSTGLYFDSELRRERIDLEGRERFSLVDIGTATLRLVPSDRLSPNERLRLTVHFQDGAVPASATFLLNVHPAKAEPVVEVSRRRRTVESYQQEAREARAEAERLRDELNRLRAERGAPGGLTGLISTQVMARQGVEARDLSSSVVRTPTSALALRNAYSYRSLERVALEVWLEAPPGAQPWTASGASLRGKSGEELTVLQVWQAEPAAPGVLRQVVVEAQGTPASIRGPFTLKLWEANGPRTVTLGNVTFP
ncbi:DUF2381 domain-containing protein [Myxococcus xanthus]|nr:hypothetical protein MyxoNM_10540 [Myxococcus xanthus]SDY01678.1 Myxococcus xanthus paralogous family TIGR02268 [Myxococcus xanthus]